MTRAEKKCLIAAGKARVSSATYSVRVCNALAKLGYLQRQPQTWGYFEITDKGRECVSAKGSIT